MSERVSLYRHRATLSTTWSIDKFSTTLYVNRVGSTRNWEGDDRTPAYNVANLHFSYDHSDDINVAFTIVNLADSRPPEEGKWEDWPFFNGYAYPNGAIGTEYFLKLNYNF